MTALKTSCPELFTANSLPLNVNCWNSIPASICGASSPVETISCSCPPDQDQTASGKGKVVGFGCITAQKAPRPDEAMCSDPVWAKLDAFGSGGALVSTTGVMTPSLALKIPSLPALSLALKKTSAEPLIARVEPVSPATAIEPKTLPPGAASPFCTSLLRVLPS